MSRRFLVIYLLLHCCFYAELNAQISPSFTQFFINPYRINSSYAGIEGRPALYLANRLQWSNIDGAPITTSLSFHTPLNYGVSFGADLYNDKRGITSTNSFSFTVGYTVEFSRKDFLRFGLSGGLGFRNIDLSQLDTNDPAILRAVDNNLFVNGNFGLSFHSGYFSIGVSLPNIFGQNLNNTEGIVMGPIMPLNEIIFNTSYRLYFGLDDMAFEPHILYRYSQVQPSQYEVAGIFHLKHVLWFGGSFRQDYGISGLVGIKFNNSMAIGYSYGLGTASLPGIGSSTNEFNLSFRFGEKRKSRKKNQKVYISFIDTERIYADQATANRKATAKRTTTSRKPSPPSKPVSTAKPNTTGSQQTNANRSARFTDEKELKFVAVSPIRTESISPGNHEFEMGKGNYVVVKEFEIEKSASQFTDQLVDSGLRAEYGFATKKNKWLVYVYRSDSKMGLMKQAEKARNKPETNEAYILSVQ